MTDENILRRIIEKKKAERDNLLVSMDRVTAEINMFVSMYNKFFKGE